MAVLRLSLLLQVGLVLGGSANHEALLKARRGIVAEDHRYHHRHHASRPHPAHLRANEPREGEEVVGGGGGRGGEGEVVTAFLRTGDSSTLARVNCSRRFELTSLVQRSATGGSGGMVTGSVVDTLLHATNFLNMILQANRSREQSLRTDIEWYHALVRSILEGDETIHRAVVTFSGDGQLISQGAPDDVLLQATRAGGEIVLQDLSGEARALWHHQSNRSAETDWFHGVRDRGKRKKPAFHKRVLSQDFTSVDNSLKRGESYIPDKTQNVKWSAPYLECQNGNFVPRWLLTLSAAFYGLKKNQAPEFR